MTVLVLVSIRGDQVNEVKLQNELTNLANQYSAKTVRLDGTRRRSATEMGGYSFTLGYIAPDMEDKYIRPISRFLAVG